MKNEESGRIFYFLNMVLNQVDVRYLRSTSLGGGGICLMYAATALQKEVSLATHNEIL